MMRIFTHKRDEHDESWIMTGSTMLSFALLYLGLHDDVRAWKGFDWEALDRLYEKGLIDNPRGKAKSVVFTEEGLRRSKERFEAMFKKQPRYDFLISRVLRRHAMA